MSERATTATLSKGRSGWCLIFRHPVCQSQDGRQRLRVRRGLGTRDDEEAQRLVDELNEILGEPNMWTPASRERAEAKYHPKVVAAFYDHLVPSTPDPWAVRELILPLPGGDDNQDGYARLLFVGTTGAGKTTVVRQLLGTDPIRERFPSISAAKTTICDTEIILQSGAFRAVVTFTGRDQVRQLISECVAAAVMSRLGGASDRDVRRRFLEHSEQRFRLSYLLGSPSSLTANDEELSDEEDEESQFDEIELDDNDRQELRDALDSYLNEVDALAEIGRSLIESSAQELGIERDSASRKDKDIVEELAEDRLVERDEFHHLTDRILDDVESRFEQLSDGTLTKGRDGWPSKWIIESTDRASFIKSINRFSSNYAPNFGRLLTPLVDGIRVAGPFQPAWHDGKTPRLVLLDGQGIGHTADSSSSISTSITRRFNLADAIVLVDNAAQPMQAAPCAVLQSLVASGHESKLILAFTHFDEVKGDNLQGTAAKKDHVIGSFDNAVHAIGKTFGREAEASLRRLIPERLIFLSGIQRSLTKKARLTRSEFSRMFEVIAELTKPAEAIEFKPVYDVANLVLVVQTAAAEFHDRWKGVLGLGTRSGVAPEHWTRVKALTRRLGVFKTDEYDNLRPVADLIRLLQRELGRYLVSPLEWEPYEPEQDSVEMLNAVDAIKKQVFTRLHDLSQQRILEERVSGWMEAYERRGPGSTRVRARDIVSLYEAAAPVPNDMPGPDTNEFIFELREIIADSVEAGGGGLRGWRRGSYDHGTATI
jgi:hypothetical protein